MEYYLISGASGFIGFHLALKLLEKNLNVIGIDNLNDYYDTNLKYSRLSLLKKYPNFIFFIVDISKKVDLEKIFTEYKISTIIHLAAQAGVRYSLINPDIYIETNIVGTFNIFEMARIFNIKKVLYASSSSVYGETDKSQFEESDFVDKPVSLYAATKKSNELMAFTYSHLYKINTIGLRFFTVYGPFGRPDMSYFSFLNDFFQNKPIKIFNNGNIINDLSRDFTFIEDIIDGIAGLLDYSFEEFVEHYYILNIGNNKPVKLMTFINVLEDCLSISLNRKVEFMKEFVPMKQGDVSKTFSSITSIKNLIGYEPKTTIEIGLQKFTDWYVNFYKKI